jgi:hypothetical protein
VCEYYTIIISVVQAHGITNVSVEDYVVGITGVGGSVQCVMCVWGDSVCSVL